MVKAEVGNNTAAVRFEIEQMKGDIKDVEGGLLTWSDKVVSLQIMVNDLKGKGGLERTNENVRIVGVSEQLGCGSPTAVSKLLRK